MKKNDRKSEEEVFTELENLLFNIHAGLPKENLSEHEIKLLEKAYGKEWIKLF